MDNRFDSDAEIIDVAYQNATDDELFQTQQAQKSQQQTDQESEDALVELAREVMLDPDRCFCRNCGAPAGGGKFCTNCGSPLF